MGAPTAKVGVQTYYFAENCMKMKEVGPPGARPWCPLDPGCARFAEIWTVFK